MASEGSSVVTSGAPTSDGLTSPTVGITPTSATLINTNHTNGSVGSGSVSAGMTSLPIGQAVPVGQAMTPTGAAVSTPRTVPATQGSVIAGGVLDKRRLGELVKEVDPMEQLDEEVEEMLMQIADDFIDNVVTAACQIAKHRKANTVEVKDVQLHLERNWNMWVPGFGSEELKPFKKATTTEAHKQRMALIKKTLKKF